MFFLSNSHSYQFQALRRQEWLQCQCTCAAFKLLSDRIPGSPIPFPRAPSISLPSHLPTSEANWPIGRSSRPWDAGSNHITHVHSSKLYQVHKNLHGRLWPHFKGAHIIVSSLWVLILGPDNPTSSVSVCVRGVKKKYIYIYRNVLTERCTCVLYNASVALHYATYKCCTCHAQSIHKSSCSTVSRKYVKIIELNH